MVDFYEERNFMSILPRHGAQHAKGGGNRIAPALNRQPHDVLRVEVIRVSGETSPGRMLDALVHWQNGKITGAAEPAVLDHSLQIAQHAVIAIRPRKDAIHDVRPGNVQPFLRDL